MTWSNPKVLALVTVIFLCGAAVGAAVTRGYFHKHSVVGTPAAYALERARSVGLKKLKLELGLSAAQEQTVMKILDDYAKFYQTIEDEREDVAEVGEQRISDALTPDQRKLFKKFLGLKNAN